MHIIINIDYLGTYSWCRINVKNMKLKCLQPRGGGGGYI